MKWPTNREELSTYGIETLADHFSSLFSEAQLFNMIEGPNLKSFSPDKCIAFWLDGHKRHVGGHKMIMSETCPTETTEKQID